MKALELAYVGMISREMDNELKEEVPQILKEFDVIADWSFQEATLQHEPPYRNIGWDLSRELTEFERIEFNYAIRMIFDELVQIIRI